MEYILIDRRIVIEAEEVVFPAHENTKQRKYTDLHIIQLDQECINIAGHLNCRYD